MTSKRPALRGPVVGHGIDIVGVADFSHLICGSASTFLSRYFRESEVSSVGDAVNRLERLAGRFAAKEAVLKALGVGWGDGIAFTDVEVSALESGAPTVQLYRQLAVLAHDGGIAGWRVSISHTSEFAVASAIAIGTA